MEPSSTIIDSNSQKFFTQNLILCHLFIKLLDVLTNEFFIYTFNKNAISDTGLLSSNVL